MGLFFRTKKSFFDAAMVGDLYELKAHLDKFSINTRNEDGNTVLHMVVEYGHLDALRLLLENRPNLEQHDRKGRTALMRAMEKDRPQITLALIGAGADANAHGKDYVYPLHKASASGEMDIVRALVEHGADVNARTREHEDTALHMAIESGRRGVAEYLVKQGARIDIAGKDGKTQAQLAKDTGPKMLEIVDPGAALREYKPPPSPTETWDIVNQTTVSKISTLPSLNRKLTEIFNFETQERKTLSTNMKTGEEIIGPAEPFGALTDGIVETAAEKLQLLGGKVPSAGPGAKRPRIDDSPIGRINF